MNRQDHKIRKGLNDLQQSLATTFRIITSVSFVSFVVECPS